MSKTRIAQLMQGQLPSPNQLSRNLPHGQYSVACLLHCLQPVAVVGAIVTQLTEILQPERYKSLL